MGYETSYELTTLPVATQTDEVTAKIKALCSGYSPFEQSCKWYQHDENMKTVSRDFPHLILVLDGEGEDQGDVWRKAYLNGEIVFEWKLPVIERPSIPVEILNRIESAKQAKIAALKAELKELEES